MNKLIAYAEITFLSSIMAIFRTAFGTIHTSYIILLILIGIDTITGMSVAFKYGRFCSKGLCKLLKKVITYTIAIATVKLLEIGILTLIDTIILSQIIVSFLQITEAVSILENLTLLGVPLPTNLINFLLRHIKIPGLSDAIRIGRNDTRDISEIDDIIKYQITAFQNEDIRNFLKIKFKFWKTLAMHTNSIFLMDDNSSKEHLYYKLMSIMEIELKDMNKEMKEEKIPQEYINIFEEKYRPIVDKWLNNIKKISYSEKDMEKKKNEIIDSIVVLSYETILTAHRVFESLE